MNIALTGILLIVANVLISHKGLTDFAFFEKHKFEVDKVLINKEHIRLISSGFLHLDWQHLLFNMVSLYLFSGSLETQFGLFTYLLIYFTGLLGGNLFVLYIHRNHGDYSAAGASGAVCGIIFASIALFPGMRVGLFFLPLFFPAWLYGILYIGYTIYGIKSRRDNIGHEAHLGGALIGMLTAILIRPEVLTQNYIPILAVLVPCAIFIYLIVTKPHILFVDNFFFKAHQKHYTIEHKYNEKKVKEQKELDRLLDKIHAKGINSLTQKEKEKLEELSGKQ